MLTEKLKHPTTAELTPPIFVSRDRFGATSIHAMNNIVVTQFSGPCSNSLVVKYVNALNNHIATLNQSPWGYLSVSDNFEAVTDKALETLSVSFMSAQKQGCVADAYIIKSAVGRSQIRQMREQFSTHQVFDDILFESFEQAYTYLRTRLESYSA